MKIKYTTKYFPFSPGIPWKCQNGMYIVPEISADVWEDAVGDRAAAVLAYGGLLESFYSLTILEALNKQSPSRSLLWSGNDIYRPLVWTQGLAKAYRSPVDSQKAKKYPVPLFMDKGKTAYFNCLNNYITIKGYFQKNEKPNKQPVIKQIFDNSLMEWDMQYVPKLRNIDTGPFVKWAKQARFYQNKPYILLFPSSTPYTIHGNRDCLGWNQAHIRQLAALTSQLGISVVLCSDYPYDYNIRIYKAPLDLKIIISLLTGARAVLAHDIDYLLLALSISPKATIFGKTQLKDIFNLYDNAEFLFSENVISTGDDLSPMDVYMTLEGAR